MALFSRQVVPNILFILVVTLTLLLVPSLPVIAGEPDQASDQTAPLRRVGHLGGPSQRVTVEGHYAAYVGFSFEFAVTRLGN